MCFFLRQKTLLILTVVITLQGCTVLNSTMDEAKQVYSAITKADHRKEYSSDKPVVLFILDTSGSMLEMENGATKLDTARKSIVDTISQIDKTRYNTSLVTFNKYLKCKADVAVEPNNNDPDNVVVRINSINARGATPLAEAIALSGKILDKVDKKMVILLSDGRETCGGDPVSAARIIDQKYGIKLNLQVIGYAVDSVTERQLQRIANINPKWNYHLAKDPQGLSNAINTITRQGGLLDPLWIDINTSTFQFNAGSTELSQEYMIKIQKVYDYLKHNNSHILILGHTDSVGSVESNMRLSLERANIVKRKLIELGIQEHRIQTKGRGEEEAINSNQTAEGRQQNRRVVIKVLS
ncbi:MAG: OmpA family protein [Pseudomonadales bacterium]|nr:OmpA family protein [Pseudomonadales bacterium]